MLNIVNNQNNIAIGFQAMSQLNNINSNSNVAAGLQAMQSANGNLSGNSFFWYASWSFK
jgi:hypothetical protein